jgi:hypothetical protein
MQAVAGDALFISTALRFCYAIQFNRTPNADKIFGEYTFLRQYLFDAGVISERCIMDVLGDTVFIDPEGLRSYNAIIQLQNEGRNSIFSKKVSPLFKGLLQDDSSACIVFDNYALFSVNTIYGRKILVYDTLTQSFASMDDQTLGFGVKQFAKIETNVVQLYAITTNDKLYRLYASNELFAVSSVRLGSMCSQNPQQEIQPTEFRCVLSGFLQDSTVRCDSFVNNRMNTKQNSQTKDIPFVAPPTPYAGTPDYADVDTQINNIVFNRIGSNQGWKAFFTLQWAGGGTITNTQATTKDLSPNNPLLTQSARGQ